MDELSAAIYLSVSNIHNKLQNHQKIELIIISESEYSQPMAARIKSAGWRELEAKKDGTGNVKSFCSDHLRYHIQDLKQKGSTINILVLYYTPKIFMCPEVEVP